MSDETTAKFECLADCGDYSVIVKSDGTLMCGRGHVFGLNDDVILVALEAVVIVPDK